MWYTLVDWFSDAGERHNLIRDFNKSAMHAFINGRVPTLLEVRITIGSLEFRDASSKVIGGGIRIKALSGQPLQKTELNEIGKVVLDNKELVRKLVALGWDTLEVHDVKGLQGCEWALKNYTNI